MDFFYPKIDRTDRYIHIYVSLKHNKVSSLVEWRACVNHLFIGLSLHLSILSFNFFFLNPSIFQLPLTQFSLPLTNTYPASFSFFDIHIPYILFFSFLLAPILSLRFLLWYAFFLILFLSSQITHACTRIPWVLCHPVMFVLKKLCSCYFCCRWWPNLSLCFMFFAMLLCILCWKQGQCWSCFSC